MQNLVDIQWLASLLLGAALVAALIKGKLFRIYPLFAGYAFADWSFNVASNLFRDQLFHYSVFIPKELVLDVMIVGVAFSHALRVFNPYAGIRRSMKSFLVFLFLMCLAYCFYIPGFFASVDAVWFNLNLHFHPRLLSTAALLFLIITMSIHFYNLKVRRADKRIILGFLVYLGPIALGYFFLERFEEAARHLFNVFSVGMYLVAQLIWISIYWHRHDVLDTADYRPT